MRLSDLPDINLKVLQTSHSEGIKLCERVNPSLGMIILDDGCDGVPPLLRRLRNEVGCSVRVALPPDGERDEALQRELVNRFNSKVTEGHKRSLKVTCEMVGARPKERLKGILGMGMPKMVIPSSFSSCAGCDSCRGKKSRDKLDKLYVLFS